MSNLHIKIETAEAISAKREVLIMQKSFLEIIKSMKNYDALRKKELVYKLNLKKDLADLSKSVEAEELTLPKEEAEFNQEKFEKEKHVEDIKKKAKKQEQEKRKDEIESQIEEIRKKLAQLS